MPTTTSSAKTTNSHTVAASVGERIAQLRKRQGLSQASLSAAASISREAIGKYERGIASPSVDTAARIAAALEVSLDSLVGGQSTDADDLAPEILERARELDALPDDERKPVLAVLDAYLRDVRIRRAYS